MKEKGREKFFFSMQDIVNDIITEMGANIFEVGNVLQDEYDNTGFTITS